jgi:hypothetical protein
MSTRITCAFFALGLLFNVLPSSAQYAYHQVALPTEVSIDPEVGPKAVSYKLVHGVVQGAQGALPGATVWLHGTKTVVVTNAEGEFELRIPADAKVLKLTCSYGGLQEEEVSLAPVQALGSVYLLRPN